MSFNGTCGQCVFIRKINSDISHLFVIVTEPYGEDEEIVMVNLTTQRSGSDTTVILKDGDHPYVERPTVISYPDATITSRAKLVKLVEVYEYEPSTPFRDEILSRMQRGLIESPYTPNKVKTFFRTTEAGKVATLALAENK